MESGNIQHSTLNTEVRAALGVECFLRFKGLMRNFFTENLLPWEKPNTHWSESCWISDPRCSLHL
jgi:hypothetical protein